MAEQIAIGALLGAPELALGVDDRCRHDQMDMGVVVEPARIGVQYGDGAGGSFELLVVLAERVHRVPARAHHQIVDQFLVSPAQRPQFGRQRERQQEVLGRHLLGDLAFQPLLALVMLAMRAMAMAAGMRHQDLMVATLALDLHLQAGLGTASGHGRQRPQMIGVQLVPILRQEVAFESVDDGGESDHLTFPQSTVNPFIKPLILSMA